MKRLLAIILVFLIIWTMIPGMAETASVTDNVIAAALTELTVDGELTAELLTNPTRYRPIVLHNEKPEERSIRGENWFVRFDALDKQNDDSYIAALNEDLSLRYLDIALCDAALAHCPTIDFAGLLDRYRDQYGPSDSWPAHVWMAFSVEMCKGQPDGRNAWRIQHAVFIPEPEQAIGREEAQRLAVLACGDEKLSAYTCVCLLDGSKAIYRIGISEGQGWQYMAEIDCLSGEMLSVTPYDPVVNRWLDCYIPQSLVNVLPDAAAFENSGTQHFRVETAAAPRGINPHSFAGADKGSSNSYFSLAPDEALPADAVWQLALQTLDDGYGIAAETLQTYEVSFGYCAQPNDFGGQPYWQFDFEHPTDPLDVYEILLDAKSGDVLYICGPGEGNG